MKTVGMFDAKTHFSELVAGAMNGETTVVTKNGRPVAEIAPVKSDGREGVRAALQRVRRHGQEILVRNRREVRSDEVKAWIEEGRRHA